MNRIFTADDNVLAGGIGTLAKLDTFPVSSTVPSLLLPGVFHAGVEADFPALGTRRLVQL